MAFAHPQSGASHEWEVEAAPGAPLLRLTPLAGAAAGGGEGAAGGVEVGGLEMGDDTMTGVVGGRRVAASWCLHRRAAGVCSGRWCVWVLTCVRVLRASVGVWAGSIGVDGWVRRACGG